MKKTKILSKIFILTTISIVAPSTACNSASKTKQASDFASLENYVAYKMAKKITTSTKTKIMFEGKKVDRYSPLTTTKDLKNILGIDLKLPSKYKFWVWKNRYSDIVNIRLRDEIGQILNLKAKITNFASPTSLEEKLKKIDQEFQKVHQTYASKYFFKYLDALMSTEFKRGVISEDIINITKKENLEKHLLDYSIKKLYNSTPFFIPSSWKQKYWLDIKSFPYLLKLIDDLPGLKKIEFDKVAKKNEVSMIIHLKIDTNSEMYVFKSTTSFDDFGQFIWSSNVRYRKLMGNIWNAIATSRFGHGLKSGIFDRQMLYLSERLTPNTQENATSLEKMNKMFKLNIDKDVEVLNNEAIKEVMNTSGDVLFSFSTDTRAVTALLYGVPVSIWGRMGHFKNIYDAEALGIEYFGKDTPKFEYRDIGEHEEIGSYAFDKTNERLVLFGKEGRIYIIDTHLGKLLNKGNIKANPGYLQDELPTSVITTNEGNKFYLSNGTKTESSAIKEVTISRFFSNTLDKDTKIINVVPDSAPVKNLIPKFLLQNAPKTIEIILEEQGGTGGSSNVKRYFKTRYNIAQQRIDIPQKELVASGKISSVIKKTEDYNNGYLVAVNETDPDNIRIRSKILHFDKNLDINTAKWNTPIFNWHIEKIVRSKMGYWVLGKTGEIAFLLPDGQVLGGKTLFKLKDHSALSLAKLSNGNVCIGFSKGKIKTFKLDIKQKKLALIHEAIVLNGGSVKVIFEDQEGYIHVAGTAFRSGMIQKPKKLKFWEYNHVQILYDKIKPDLSDDVFPRYRQLSIAEINA